MEWWIRRFFLQLNQAAGLINYFQNKRSTSWSISLTEQMFDHNDLSLSITTNFHEECKKNLFWASNVHIKTECIWSFQLPPPYLLPYYFDHLLQYVPVSNLKVHIITTVLHHCLQKLRSRQSETITSSSNTNEFEI